MSNHTLTCPHCHKIFSVDESEYASLLNQVAKAEIAKEVHEKLAAADREKQNEIRLAEAKVTNTLQQKLADKESEISSLTAKLEKISLEKDKELAEKRSQLETQLSKVQSEQLNQIA